MIYIICTWHSGNENSIYDGNTAFNSIVWHINKEWLNVSIWRNSCYSRNVTLCLMKYWTPVKCSPLNLEIQLPFAWWAVLSDGTKSNWGSPYLTLIFLLTTYGFNSNAKNFLGILPQSAGPDSVPSYSSINSGCDLSSDPSHTSIHSLSSMTYNSSFFFFTPVKRPLFLPCLLCFFQNFTVISVFMLILYSGHPVWLIWVWCVCIMNVSYIHWYILTAELFFFTSLPL